MWQYNTNAKMINFDDRIKANIKKHNLNWPLIPNHPHKILKIRGSGSLDNIYENIEK